MPDTEKEALCARIDELCAEVERLRQENQSIGMAAYEVGYRNGSIHYELEHCPSCKNIADLQEVLEENAKLRELVRVMAYCNQYSPDCDGCRMNGAAGIITERAGCDELLARLRELGLEVTE